MTAALETWTGRCTHCGAVRIAWMIDPVRDARDHRKYVAQCGRARLNVVRVTRLIDEAPDLFALHPMPRRRLLFLTAFDPQLLGARLRALLASLPEPFLPPPPQKPALKGGNPTHE